MDRMTVVPSQPSGACKCQTTGHGPAGHLLCWNLQQSRHGTYEVHPPDLIRPGCLAQTNLDCNIGRTTKQFNHVFKLCPTLYSCFFLTTNPIGLDKIHMDRTKQDRTLFFCGHCCLKPPFCLLALGWEDL